MRKPTCEILLLGLCALALAGCTTTTASTSNPTPPANSVVRERNEGYSLLYKLMGDESNVDKLLIIKHADKPVHDLIKEVSEFAKDAKKQMDDLKKNDGTLSFETPDLPAVEQESRDQTSKSDAKELLTSSGKPLELRLVFTQIQAVGYGSELAEALEKHEHNAPRMEFLKSVSQRCGVYRERLLGLLAVD